MSDMCAVSRRGWPGSGRGPVDGPAGLVSGAASMHGPDVVSVSRRGRRVTVVEADPLVRPAALRAAGRLAVVSERPLRLVGIHGLKRVSSCPLLGALRASDDPAAASPVHTLCYTVRDVLVAELHMAHRCADSFAVLIPGEDGNDVLQTLAWPSRVDAVGLTVREVDVLALVLARLTDAEIAERLVVSLTTVRSHLRAVRQKLGAHDRRSIGRAMQGFEQQQNRFGQEPLLATYGWRDG